jgi:hypothetical protein
VCNTLSLHDALPILDKFDILLFDQPYLEREWTKKEIYRYFNLVPDNSTQYSAGSFAFRITKQTIQLIDEWNKLSKNAYDLFTDHSRLKQLPEFKENRHDQSIFSILNETPRRKQRGILLYYNFFFVASDGEFNP